MTRKQDSTILMNRSAKAKLPNVVVEAIANGAAAIADGFGIFITFSCNLIFASFIASGVYKKGLVTRLTEFDMTLAIAAILALTEIAFTLGASEQRRRREKRQSEQ